MKKVTVMYRNNYFGGDGWIFYPMQIEIGDNCPVCGGPRGEPQRVAFYENDESHSVDQWDNPCGHLDTYKKCLVEAGVVA